AEVRVDYFSTVRFETNSYSVPVKWSGKQVTVKASGLELNIYYRGEKIASHPRCYRKYQTIYQLEHYIPLIEQRPRSVFHAKPVKEAKLPEQIFEYAKKLKNPDKAMVKLLRLIVDQGLESVLKALETAQEKQQYSLDIIEFNLTRKSQVIPLAAKGPVVNPVDIKAYDQLLSGGAQI
ncbi:MAG: IS21 family transposase, partial [Syntrophomonadaceae bacterium]